MQFTETQWSVVLKAQRDDLPGAAAAFEDLCRAYWLPLFGWLRSEGKSPEDAEDMVQGFFAQVVERRLVALADPDKGKFRNFLLKCLQTYVREQHRNEGRLKRGGGQRTVPIDVAEAEEKLRAMRAAGRSPDEEYDRLWAMTLLDRAVAMLAEEQQAAGQGERFARLRPFLLNSGKGGNMEALAEELQLSVNALHAAVFRLRQRFRALVQQEVLACVESPEALAEELQYLMTCLT